MAGHAYIIAYVKWMISWTISLAHTSPDFNLCSFKWRHDIDFKYWYWYLRLEYWTTGTGTGTATTLAHTVESIIVKCSL